MELLEEKTQKRMKEQENIIFRLCRHNHVQTTFRDRRIKNKTINYIK